MSEREELDDLDALHAEGMLTDEEHAHARHQLMGHRHSPGAAPPGTADGAAGDAAEMAGEIVTPDPDLAVATTADLAAEARGPGEQPDPTAAGHDGAQPSASAGAARRGARWRSIPAPGMLAVGIAAGACIGIGLIVFALVGGGSSTPSGIAVNGIVAVTDHTSVVPDGAFFNGQHFGTGDYTIGKGCHTLSGYQDIVGGAAVVISDNSGKVLAHTQLRAGVFDTNADCVFGFTTRVPSSSGYQLKIADRNTVQYPTSGIADPQLVLG